MLDLDKDKYDLEGVTGLTADSRAVQPGYLFAALEGAQSDGNDYIQDAINAGAVAILSRHAHDLPAGVRLIRADNPRNALAEISAQFYGAQPKTVVAVTGTNGKSSVVNFLQQLWQAAGHKAASLGTMNAKLTSPDPITLHETLAALEGQGITHLALEASSHGLDQRRIDGVHLSAAAYTNLSRDHMDYHETMDAYLQAKARLFRDCISAEGYAVINADTPEAEVLIKASKAPVMTYGYHGWDLRLKQLQPREGGCNVQLEILEHDFSIHIPLVGEFQIMNLLCAAGLYLASDRSDAAIAAVVAGMQAIKSVKGRMQLIAGHPQGAQVYIDYAHTPDALETVLKAVRPHVKGKLFCAFGCGGDRDKGKRPLMGEGAANHCDRVIITDDNPRNEKAVDIRNQILAPIRKAMHNENIFEIDDRAAAIDFSIKQLKAGDCLIIAGKGHESGQIVAGETIPFDDAVQATKAVQRLKENHDGTQQQRAMDASRS